MKSFNKNDLSYRQLQDVNGGQQWRCDYPDGQWAAAMVYKSRPTRQDVIDALEQVNELSAHKDDE